MVCASLLGSYKMPSGLGKTGTGTGQKAGWLGNATGVGCNLMLFLLGKRPLLGVRPEAVAGYRNGVNVVAIVVRIDEVGLDGQRHPRRYWGNCHPWRWRWNCQDCRLWGNANGECRPCDGALEYFGKVNNGLLLGVAELVGTRCDNGCVNGGGFWHRTLVRKELPYFGGALGYGIWDIQSVAAILFGSRT